MKTLSVSKNLLNPIVLPGMGKSVELNHLTNEENQDIRQAFAENNLQIEFLEEPGQYHAVINLWADPHSMARMTLFIK